MLKPFMKYFILKHFVRTLLVFSVILHTGVQQGDFILFKDEETIQDTAFTKADTNDSEVMYLRYTATTTKPQMDAAELEEPEYYEEPEQYSDPYTPKEIIKLQEEYLEALPNFNDTNLRISEIKCEEYSWGVIRRDEESELTVIGGRDAAPSEFPHMAAIGWPTGRRPKWIFKCGGTLISDKFVLTAGHCSSTVKADSSVSDIFPQIVRLGVIRIDIAAKSAKNDYEIEKFIKHPNYHPPKQQHDIALIELKQRIIRFTQNLHPACLWTKYDTSSLGKDAIVTGWGVISQGPPPVFSNILQVGEVEIMDMDICHELLLPYCSRKQCGVKDHQLCAGLTNGMVDTCQSDSGGPIQVEKPLNIQGLENSLYYVIGVTSYGLGCAKEETPSVYTRVASFIDWIEAIVWPK